MHDPYANKMQSLEQAILTGPGQLDAHLRQAAANSGDLPAELQTYARKVSQHAYKVTDEDITDLIQAGYSEDQIFELTISLAVGAGLTRLKAAQAALAEGEHDATAQR